MRADRNALLRRYLGGGAYTDCYVSEAARAISHSEYVEAFEPGLHAR